MKPVKLLVAGDPNQYTGGYIYDARITNALIRAGCPVQVIGLAGRFPRTDKTAANALENALVDCLDDQTVIIDGLVLGNLPAVVARHTDRLHLVALMHHPLADESGLDQGIAASFHKSERSALHHVRQVVTTSAFTAQRLVRDYGVNPRRIHVVEPGVNRPTHPPAKRAGKPRLLCVATITPRKGHLVLVEALSELADIDWHCSLVGDASRDLEHVAKVKMAIQRHHIQRRIKLVGCLPAEELARQYHDASIFVLPSLYEGYGMVIAEALAYGLPVVTTTGGALIRTLPKKAGIAVPPGDTHALAAALRRVLVDTELRNALAAQACRAAESLPTWNEAGERFRAVLEQPGDAIR